ncbi:MAG: oxidoreductase [Subtercola sp.]|nr:oxidoreductase [Subtercola sp.]
MRSTLVINAFTEFTPSHTLQGMWRVPDAVEHRALNSMDSWLDLARIAERGCLDTIMFADAIGLGGDFDANVREGILIQNDPTSLIPAMATVTENLGFVVTGSILQDHPFQLARRMSTLDHLTKGRIGWNVVTSYSDEAWKNFGQPGVPSHADRYAWADEYMEVVYKLWEGSWDDQAIVHDRETGVWADPAHVRQIDHVGTRYQVTGPHMVEPSPQRSPVIFQAGSSEAGRTFAATHGEATFINSADPKSAKTLIDDIRARAVSAGRKPDDLYFTQAFTFIVGSTEEEANRKADEMFSYLNIEGMASKLSGYVGMDLTKLDPSVPLSEWTKPGITGIFDAILAAFPPGYNPTLAEIVEVRSKNGLFIGTPEQIADQLQDWQHAGLTAINVLIPTRNSSLVDFVDFVIPELQRRGISQREYTPGTLRRKLHGSGDRLPSNHIGASYRKAPLLHP